MRSAAYYARIVSAILAAAFFFGAPVIAQTGSASVATYRVSRHQVSTAANHEVRFKTPAGIDASTDTIVLSDYAGFTFGSVGPSDVSLFHGPVTGSETRMPVAASASAGVWGVIFSGTSITFTAPTDAVVGTIPTNDYIVIRIGTNTPGALNQITNPSSVQLARIGLGGTFGDTAIFSIPIVTSDSVLVTATVGTPSSTPIGGGGPGDVVPPQLFNIQVINITSSTASIVWSTDESSNSTVEYGLTIGYGSGTISDAGFVVSHVIDLVGLSPATTYHFRVSSRDAASNLATSGDGVFTTLGDTMPPIISNIQVVDITDTSVRVTWDTDELADSAVGYGTTTGYGLSLSDLGFVTTHSIVLSGLMPNTAYHFFVSSKDQSNNATSSNDGTFLTTFDQTPPANVVAFSAVGGDTVIHLSWGPPPDPDYAGVRIVRRTDAFPTSPFDGSLVYVGSGTTTDDIAVVNGVTYFYAAFAFDGNNNYASGALAQATPQGPPVPPQPENTNGLCSNGVDDDQDGAIDCADADCVSFQICKPPPQPTPENTNPLCTNGVDDDLDGLVDCADPGCSILPACLVPPQVPQPQPQPQPIPQQPQPTPGGNIILIEPHFFGAGGTIELTVDASQTFGAIAGSGVLVSVPVTGLGVSPDAAFVTVNGATYQLIPSGNGTAWVGTFVAPVNGGSYDVTVSMTFLGGGAAVSHRTMTVVGAGIVVEEGIGGKTNIAIPDATVTLFVEQGNAWVKWNGAPYGEANPQSTSFDGVFSFTVPNGRYYAEVEKNGYVKRITDPKTVTNNIFGDSVGLVHIPLAPLLAVTGTQPLVENIFALGLNAMQQAAFATTLLRTFIQQPEVQQTVQNTFAPSLLGIGILNLAGAVPLFNFFAYIQYLFTQPILLLWRKKKKQWGVVYNALTKQPVDLAIVRLLDAQTKTLLQTRVTDRFGRYSFIVVSGRYILEVVKPGYLFPSTYLKEVKEDVDFIDLYHGYVIEVGKEGVVSANVPLDPVVPVETPRQVVFKKILRRLQQDVAFISIVLAIVGLVIIPSVEIALFLLAQVGFYLLFRKISVETKGKKWGVVVDAKSHKTLGRVIIRIFDKKFNKLLETQATDANGKYGFFVRRNIYYVTAEKEGYETYTSPDIDLTSKDEALIDQNISLQVKAILKLY